MNPSPHSRPLRVLVVDDCQDTVNSCALMLEAWGYKVHKAHDGPRALEAARVARPDVVLLDIGLPGASGWDVARRLREECGLGGALVVALTGYGQAEDRERSREVGIDVHLLKPADPEELLRVLTARDPA